MEVAVLDRPPAVNGTGPTGAPEGSPHKPSLREQLSADMAKGKENRLDAGKRISGFLSSMKQKLYGGVDLAFATPKIAGTLGGAVIEAGHMVNDKIVDARDRMVLKAQDAGDVARGRIIDAKDRVVESGHRANDSIVDTRDRWVLRAQNAGDVVRGRMKETGYAAGRKTVELSKKAAAFGIARVVVPLENSAQAICEIPADLNQWRADSLRTRAEGLTARAILESTRGEARAAALKIEADRVQKEAQEKFSSMGKTQAEASKKAAELSGKARDKRARVGGVFGKARALLTALQTT